jgi:prophage maintenance system killer protein
MKQIPVWSNRLNPKMLGQILAGVLLVVSLLIINFPAQALTINESPNQPVTSTTTANISEPTTTAPESLAPSPLPKWVTKTQLTFDKALTKTKTAIADLASQLEEAATTTDVVVQKQIKKSLENKQDVLENAADKIDDLVEKLQKANKKLAATVGDAPNELQSQLQIQAQNLQQSLDAAVQTINTLADSTEKAKKNTTEAFRTQINNQIEAVNQALEKAQQAIQGLGQSPA